MPVGAHSGADQRSGPDRRERTGGGRFVGRGLYIIAHYDNPTVRTPLPRWMLDQIKHQGRVLVNATYTSQDMGGLKKVNRGTWYLSFTG